MKENPKKVIILNKPFIGSWNNIPKNIPHEIIDFLLTDSDNYYAYNNPWGTCPNWIQVGKSLSDKETHEAEYLLLTDTWSKTTGETKILFCIKLKQKLHKLSRSKNPATFLSSQSIVKDIIDENNIIYSGKKLYNIYPEPDDTLYVTFEAEKMIKAKNPITVKLNYTYQRNKGYIKSDISEGDYNTLIDIINKPELWEEIKLPTLKSGFTDFDDFVKKNKTFRIYRRRRKNLLTN